MKASPSAACARGTGRDGLASDISKWILNFVK